MLAAGLHARRAEIEQAAATRVYGVAGTSENVDPEYVQGLRAAISTAIDYAVLSIKRGEEGEEAVPFPGPLLLQARRAARNGISIDTVLRRYMGGYSLFADFLIQEAERNGVDAVQVQALMRRLGQLFDRLLAAVATEYERETEMRVDTAEMRRTERLQRLIDGEYLDTQEFNYDFEGYHVGALASGSGALEAIRKLASALDRRLLTAQQSDGVVSAWMGGRWGLPSGKVESVVSRCWPEGVPLALGELSQGLDGWRLTHRQARATFAIAQQKGGEPVHYANVALLASALNDDLLEASLRKVFLEPLEQDRDGGEAATRDPEGLLLSWPQCLLSRGHPRRQSSHGH